MKNAILLGLLAAQATTASAQCPFSAGDVVNPTPLNELVTKAKNLNVEKDEFETSAAYQARLNEASKGIFPDTVIVSVSIPATTQYNADTQEVTLSSWYLPLRCSIFETDLSAAAKALKLGPPRPSYETSAQCLTHVVARERSAPYEASNSYGAKVMVTDLQAISEGLFFGFGRSWHDPNKTVLQSNAPPIFSFAAPADDARSLKDNAALIFAVRPVAPYYVKGTYYHEATIQSPTAITSTDHMLAATPICFGLMDLQSGKIFATKGM